MGSEREYFEELRDKTFTRARENGLEIVLPASNQLQLDYDKPWSAGLGRLYVFEQVINTMHVGTKLIDRFLQEIAVQTWEAWKSSGGNCHVMITLCCDFTPTERIAMQSILGSDPMREFLNLRRVMCGAEDPIALFRPRDTSK